ncbi:MAG: polysaccharide deacetylase family protein [Colwellia sp.]|nr:polysaccharide deacetylase family protein [Colwellia sp.]
MKKIVLATLLCCFSINSLAAVILQYHHVSETTPKSTSITPAQFEVHLQYLKDNNFTVVPLSELINSVKKQKTLKDKTVAITFDDAYQDIMTNAKPILDKFNYPYTIFVNPNTINLGAQSYLSWLQLKGLADAGVIIANHGFKHDSMARKPQGITNEQWLNQYSQLLLDAERIIEEETGQSWRFFAYPYGEYTPADQQWMKDNNFVAFTQQSGAIGLSTDLSIVPRFPASQPYDKISGLRDKLNSLPLNIRLNGQNADTIFERNTTMSITLNVAVDDFNKSQLNCYISGLGRQEINWHEDNSFTINFSAALPTGRVRCNCTAPSISKPGRYYWYSKPWFILKEGGQWYPL